MTVNGKTQTYTTDDYTTETSDAGTVRIFQAPVTLDEAGYYDVKAYSSSGGSYSSSAYSFDIRVVSTTDETSTSRESRRLSDEMLDVLAQFEGFLPSVYYDTLAYNVPTIGYGYVITPNTQFYNDLTESEGKAMLIQTVNGSFASALNQFIDENDVAMSQSQFDGLLSLSYNIGTGNWYRSDFDLKKILLNSVVLPEDYFDGGKTYGGTVTYSEGTELMSDHSTTSSVLRSDIGLGTEVTVLDYWYDSEKKSGWYKVNLNGKKGWMHSGFIALDTASSFEIDLAESDSFAIGSEMLMWHSAGGECLPGLLYRRLAEAKVITFANYDEAYHSSSNYTHNTYGFKYPSCMTQYEE